VSSRPRIRIEEALKFLNIAEYCTGNIPVTQEIDDVWHLWILETREYARLCQMLQGRRFIHHMSNAFMDCNSDSVPSMEDELEDQVALLGAYVLNYGPFEPDRVRYWKLAAQLMDQFGWTLEELNEWLVSALVNMGSGALPDSP